MESPAIFIVLSRPLSIWTIHGLIYLTGIDPGKYKERYLLPKSAYVRMHHRWKALSWASGMDLSGRIAGGDC